MSAKPKARSDHGTKKKGRLTIAFFSHYFGRNRISFSLWNGVKDAAREEDINIICFPSNPLESPAGFQIEAEPFSHLVNKQRIDGLLMWGAGLSAYTDPDSVSNFYAQFADFPIYNIGLVMKDIPSLIIDNYCGMREAVQHLIEKHACRRIAFIRGPEWHQEAELRFRAYRDVLEKNRLPVDNDLIATGDFTRASGNAAIRELCLKRKVDFDAVAAASDLMALGASEELLSLGTSIPQAVKIIGFDDIPESRYFKIPLTTVKQPFFEMGRMAVQNLVAMVKQKKPGKNITIPSIVIQRQSCGCVNPAFFTSDAEQTSHAAGGQKKIPETKLYAKIIQDPTLTSCPEYNKAERVSHCLQAFMDEYIRNQKGAFLIALNQELLNCDDPGETTLFNSLLSTIRRIVLPFIRNAKKNLLRAEELWQKARILINEHFERLSKFNQLQREFQQQYLHIMNQMLISTFQMSELTTLLANQLPRLGVPSFFLSLYEQPEISLEKAVLMLARTPDGWINLEAVDIHFPSHELVPHDLLPWDRQFMIIVELLYFNTEQLGFIVLEEGPCEGYLYETIRAQLSAAIKGTLLFREKEKLLGDLENRARDLQTTSEGLARSNEELEQFAYIASHDLQEPLRKISIYTDRLVERINGADHSEEMDYIKHMQSACERMHHLIADLLLYSRLTSQSEPFTRIKLSRILKDVLADLEIPINQSKAKITVGELPEIEAHPLHMHQLFLNLLSNALKFHKPGRLPVICISSRKINSSNRTLYEILVEDNGIGIEQKYYGQIFRVFQRLHTAKQYKGTGIGLAVCKKIVDRHGGSIQIESEIDEGSRFIISLPAKQAQRKGGNTYPSPG